jgi:hypothetical protein
MQTNLDVKRLLCPMPVIRLGEMIEKIEIGDTIQIIATDPGVLHASGLPAFGWYWYSQRTKGGKDIKIDSVRPPVCNFSFSIFCFI